MFVPAQGPVVYWRPFDGKRHAFWPVTPPIPGQERDTVCGVGATLTEPSDMDWLWLTCDVCLSKARALRDSRE